MSYYYYYYYWYGTPLANHFYNELMVNLDVAYLDKSIGTDTKNNVREIRNNMDGETYLQYE